MSNGEAKRWETISIDTKIPGTRFDVDDVPRVTVISADDHERIVAGLKAQLEHSETKVTWLLRDNERVAKQRDSVIEALKVIDRDFAWHYEECAGAIGDDEFCDCGLEKVRSEIKDIEKGV